MLKLKKTIYSRALKILILFSTFLFFEPKSPNVVLGKTTYNEKFASIVNKENIFGIQFHPEKSHDNGICILKNFAEL